MRLYLDFVTLIEGTQQLECYPLLLYHCEERASAEPVIQAVLDILSYENCCSVKFLKIYDK